jgi:hypothetical protein
MHRLVHPLDKIPVENPTGLTGSLEIQEAGADECATPSAFRRRVPVRVDLSGLVSLQNLVLSQRPQHAHAAFQ